MNVRAVVESRMQGNEYLRAPGDAVVVQRGRPRWLILSCPCGCGAELLINLDPRAGPAWRLYKDARLGYTVYPSIWRDTDCESHFIIWRDTIFLFGREDDYFGWIGTDEEKAVLVDAVRLRLNDQPIPYWEIADQLGEIPWAVLQACRELVRRGDARESQGRDRGRFASR